METVIKKTVPNFILYCFLFSALLSACAALPEKKPEEIGKKRGKPPYKEPVHTKEEEKETLGIFTQILEIYESAESRQAAAPEAEILYARIIAEYPGTPLAQESYWKLITIYSEDHLPPDFEKAEAYYHEYMAKYPDAVLKNPVEQTLINNYAKHAEWGRLLKFCTPAVMEFKDNGKKPLPLVVFMYSEANYRLGNIAEAQEGFKAIRELYPTIGYSEMAEKRLEEIGQTEEKE